MLAVMQTGGDHTWTQVGEFVFASVSIIVNEKRNALIIQ